MHISATYAITNFYQNLRYKFLSEFLELDSQGFMSRFSGQDFDWIRNTYWTMKNLHRKKFSSSEFSLNIGEKSCFFIGMRNWDEKRWKSVLRDNCWFWMMICVGYFWQSHLLTPRRLLVILNYSTPLSKIKREKDSKKAIKLTYSEKRKLMSSTEQENIPQAETSEAQGVRSEDIEEFVVKLGWFLNGIYMYLKVKYKFMDHKLWLKREEWI